jgi:periplasmic copper chaperone A
MRTSRNGWAAVAAVMLVLLTSDHANAADYSIGPLRVGNPWIRATPKGAPVAGGYMTITNTGTTPDRLVGGTAALAGRVELHSMVMEQGVAKMRPVAGGIEITPGQTVELKPGSLHVMLMELKQSLKPGENVRGTLEFETAGKLEIEYAVKPLGASSPAGGGHGKH